MTTQPEALRLAQHINDLFVSQWGMNNPMAKDSKIVLDELRRLHESNQELLEALSGFLECPYDIDPATVPKAGIEAAPMQVVGNMSVALVRIRLARAAIAKATGGAA